MLASKQSGRESSTSFCSSRALAVAGRCHARHATQRSTSGDIETRLCNKAIAQQSVALTFQRMDPDDIDIRTVLLWTCLTLMKVRAQSPVLAYETTLDVSVRPRHHFPLHPTLYEEDCESNARLQSKLEWPMKILENAPTDSDHTRRLLIRTTSQ